MTKNSIIGLSLIVAVLEGFAGLGIEIYAIRVSAIYIGASTAITGIILATVLLAIAVGYWYGGILAQQTRTSKASMQKAGIVLVISSLCHAIACSIQLPILELLINIFDNPLLHAICVGLLFSIGLVFGSTSIPLITQYLTQLQNDGQKIEAGRGAGLMVATTTVGSVLGSTLTPIIMLPYFGLMASLFVFIVCLVTSAFICAFLCAQPKINPILNKCSLKIVLVGFLALFISFIFIKTNDRDTGHQTATTAWFVQDVYYEGKLAKGITDAPSKTLSSCWIIETAENCSKYGKKVINSIDALSVHNMLVFGGAGMSIPSHLAHRNKDMQITVVDIDASLPKIIEKNFLQSNLASNIHFVGDDARGFAIRYKGLPYDFLLIDALQGMYVVGNLYTVEALQSSKNISEYVMANIIGRADLNHEYTQVLLTTWQQVFGDEAYVIFQDKKGGVTNILLCNFSCQGGERLSNSALFKKQSRTNTDNFPILDKFYYKSI